MPVLNLSIEHDGRPIIELYIAVGAAEAGARFERGIAQSSPQKVRALVDTGASQSHVDMKKLEALQVNQIGVITVYGATSGNEPSKMPEYAIDLCLAGDEVGTLWQDLAVIGSPHLAGLRVDMLLGRDVLNARLLSYDGPNKQFSLAYDVADHWDSATTE